MGMYVKHIKTNIIYEGFKSPILHHAKTPDFRKESGVFYLLATLMTALLKL